MLWSTDLSDLEWLADDCRRLPAENERRVAFEAIYKALHWANLLPSRADFLDELVHGCAALQEDLAGYRTPPPLNPYDAELGANRLRRTAQTTADKASWVKLRNDLQFEPHILDGPDAFTSKGNGFSRLIDLTRWINMKARENGKEGARNWPLLRRSFGETVTEHYVSGMRQAWRLIKPERPTYNSSGSYSVKYISSLALDSLSLDSETQGWAIALTEKEVETAMRHVCFVGNTRDVWVTPLIETRPGPSLRVVKAEVAFEYKAGQARTDFISQMAHTDIVERPALTNHLFSLLKASEPADERVFELSIRAITRGREHLPSKPLPLLVTKRLEEHTSAGNSKRAAQYFSLLAFLDPNGVADRAYSQVRHRPKEGEAAHAQRVQDWLGTLFAGEGRDGVAVGALDGVSVTSLVRLVKLAYQYVPPEMDAPASDDPAKTLRDAAEGSRRTLLQALIARPGPEAFHALVDLSTDPAFTGSALRLNELAHGKAESEGDLVAWKPAEVLSFAQAHSAPVKTGRDLMRLTQAVLSDIAASFDQTDASSRSALELATNEDVVQSWLAEQLTLRSKARYRAHRETQVAQNNKPDVLISSTSVDVELAIEVKNANMGWSVLQLESALKGQLARDYLRPANRRFGVLVISLHQTRTWRVGGRVWDFSMMISHLQAMASTLNVNETGAIEVAVVPMDASERNYPNKPRLQRGQPVGEPSTPWPSPSGVKRT